MQKTSGHLAAVSSFDLSAACAADPSEKENDAMTSVDAFNESMYEAVEQAAVAHHFEHRGRWGMALALFGKLIEMGLEPELRYRPGNDSTPVWVEACGYAFDFRGCLRERPVFSFWLMEEWIPGMAMRHDGVDEDELQSDIDLAEEILTKALPAPMPGELELGSR